MPVTSQRGILCPNRPFESWFLWLTKKTRGIKVYHLNIGQPDLKTPQVAIDAIRNIDGAVLDTPQ